MTTTQPSSLFRSEEMSLIQLYIPTEVAQPAVAKLGELGLVQFRDLNPDVNAFQRAFVTEVRRMDEMERQCRFFTTQMEKAGVAVQPSPSGAYLARARTAQEIDELEAKLKDHEARIQQMNNSQETLQKRNLQLTELRFVLRETAIFFDEAESRHDDIHTTTEGDTDRDTAPLLASDVEHGGIPDSTGIGQLNLGYVTGVISRQRMQTFERVLWRSLRGNLYLNYAEIEEPIIDPATDEVIEKNVFIIFSQGRELLNKIRKISESLGATLYPIDSSSDARKDALREVTSRLEDLNNVLSTTNNTRRAELLQVAEDLATWITIVKKEKAIYHTMNLFKYDINSRALVAEGWSPTNDIPDIKIALRTASEGSGASFPVLNELQTKLEPPTYHRTNKFTYGFQAIVDAYGVAKYREVNPGLFTVITFPFLFAVMFGDLGHGLLLTLFGVYLCWKEKEFAKKDYGEIFEMVFGGRYIILLMGLFSMYTGIIYNDVFSQAIEAFPSGWAWPSNFTEGTMIEAHQVGVYPFGLDFRWHGSENYLLFTNSYKMKMAIIFGVIHMSFGIVLTVYNYRFFEKMRVSVFAEFLPQFIFMECLFGYLTICILYKWSINWWETDAEGNHIHISPPGLLNMLIFMFLSPGNVKPSEELYSGQAKVQALLLFIAAICVPWMLLAKPLLLKREHDKPRTQGYHRPSENGARVSYEHDGEEEVAGGAVITEGVEENEEEFDFSELMIHQSIHTIEFCLGCISNTASYLRLWALSLAHAQLSAVLWDMTLKIAFGMTGLAGALMLVVAFQIWFTSTVVILLIMEGLSAFLHALRLHWVEFNGKFYFGTGVPFEPFSFTRVLEAKVDL